MRLLFPVVLAGLALGAATTGRAEIEFSGYSNGREGVRFVLAEGERISDWLGLGATFRGHILTAYDAKTETLTLTREGATVRVRLKGARTAEEIATAEAADLRQRRSAELRSESMKCLALCQSLRMDLLTLQRRHGEAREATPPDAAGVDALEKSVNAARVRGQRADRVLSLQLALERMFRDGREEKDPHFVETQELLVEARKLMEAGGP